MIHVLYPSGETYEVEVGDGVELHTLVDRLGGGYISFYDGEQQISRYSRVYSGQYLRIRFHTRPEYILFRDSGELWYTDLHYLNPRKPWNPNAIELEDAIVFVKAEEDIDGNFQVIKLG